MAPESIIVKKGWQASRVAVAERRKFENANLFINRSIANQEKKIDKRFRAQIHA